MTSPPGTLATPDQPAVCNMQDAHLALLIREAREVDPALRDIGKPKLLRMARAFTVARVLDLRDQQAREVAVEEFGVWLRSNWPSLRLATFGATRRPATDPHRWRTRS